MISDKTKFKLRTTLCPLTAAIIWGAAFVAQSDGAQTIPMFTFNAARSWIGVVVLLLLCFFFRRKLPVPKEDRKRYFRDLALGGVCSGSLLCAAANLQQVGLETVDPGKAGFITSLYVVLVPVFGLFFKKRAPFTVWLGVVLAPYGLYFLCVNGSFSLATADLQLLACAVIFALQILSIDHFSSRVHGIHLATAQLATHALLSTVGMLIFEAPNLQALLDCWLPIAYLGVMSSGVAYTLQVISQKNANPALVTLFLSLESVFSVLFGWLIRGDQLSLREGLGCVIMFCAVTLANLPVNPKIKKKT